jgi:hypothetical protein
MNELSNMFDNMFVERNGVINHYGVWIDPDIPITGVISNNSASQFIYDECIDGINLDFEDHINSDDHPNNDEWCDTCEMWEYHDNTYLIGDWILDTNTQKWDHDPNGEYAAIVRESVTQVVYSKYTRRSNLCSPCYPRKADHNSDGKFLAYDLPPEAYEY